jgi:hypothetical protein
VCKGLSIFKMGVALLLKMVSAVAYSDALAAASLHWQACR